MHRDHRKSPETQAKRIATKKAFRDLHGPHPNRRPTECADIPQYSSDADYCIVRIKRCFPRLWEETGDY